MTECNFATAVSEFGELDLSLKKKKKSKKADLALDIDIDGSTNANDWLEICLCVYAWCGVL